MRSEGARERGCQSKFLLRRGKFDWFVLLLLCSDWIWKAGKLDRDGNAGVCCCLFV